MEASIEQDFDVSAVRRNTVCVVQHEAQQIRGLDTPNVPAKMRWLPMCYACSRSKLKHISRLKCLEGTHAAVTEIVCACDCGWERVRGLQAKSGPQLPFPAVVLCQKNEIQFTSEPYVHFLDTKELYCIKSFALRLLETLAVRRF